MLKNFSIFSWAFGRQIFLKRTENSDYKKLIGLWVEEILFEKKL